MNRLTLPLTAAILVGGCATATPPVAIPPPRVVGVPVATAPATRPATWFFARFPEPPPVPDADPSVREPRTFRLPTRLLAVRDAPGRLSVEVDADALESVRLDVGSKMVTGLRYAMAVREVGKPFATSGDGGGDGEGGLTSGTVAYVGTRVYNAATDGLPLPGHRYEVVARFEVFETDVPPQHMWRPEGPRYRVLWSREVRQQEQ